MNKSLIKKIKTVAAKYYAATGAKKIELKEKLEDLLIYWEGTFDEFNELVCSCRISK